MKKEFRSKHKAALFLAACLIVLFMPGIGDYRWVGLIGFIYIGLPWYILAVKDSVIEKLDNAPVSKRFRIHSPTLFVFGAISAVIGVAIDLFILYMIYKDPNPTSLLAGATRLLFGLPIFGFGAGLIYISIGLRQNET